MFAIKEKDVGTSDRKSSTTSIYVRLWPRRPFTWTEAYDLHPGFEIPGHAKPLYSTMLSIMNVGERELHSVC